SAHKGAAGSIAVALSDPDKIAAAGSATALPGDNSNALLLASLQEKAVTALGGVTFQGFYSSFVGKVGAQTRLSQNSLSVEEVIQEQLGGIREEASGVSLDEEMANLIKFQRAYEASARIITIADELLQTVIGMV
ncbi:MAG: flagellar basal body rod C-terminal domain-containing protein, partial [Nitrospiria bacterium]